VISLSTCSGVSSCRTLAGRSSGPPWTGSRPCSPVVRRAATLVQRLGHVARHHDEDRYFGGGLGRMRRSGSVAVDGRAAAQRTLGEQRLERAHAATTTAAHARRYLLAPAPSGSSSCPPSRRSIRLRPATGGKPWQWAGTARSSRAKPGPPWPARRGCQRVGLVEDDYAPYGARAAQLAEQPLP
jgi:hypothetical protein